MLLTRAGGLFAPAVVGAAAATTWNPLDTDTGDGALSGGNLTYTTPGGGYGKTRTTSAIAANQSVYAEFVIVNEVFGGPLVDICKIDIDILDGQIGTPTPSIGAIMSFIGNFACQDSANDGAATQSFTDGDNMGVAFNSATGKVWVRKNGVAWSNSGDPVAGTGGYAIPFTGPYFFMIRGSDGEVGTAKFSSSSWTYSAPSGFTQLAEYSPMPTRLDTSNLTGWTLSRGSRAVTRNGGNANAYVYSVAGNTASQKVYVEATCVHNTFGIVIGIGVDKAAGNRFADAHVSPSKGALYASNQFVDIDSIDNGTALSTFTTGDTVDMAFDAGLGKIWFRKNNGAWNAPVGGTQNPATGQGGFTVVTTPSTTYYYFVGSDSDNTDQVNVRFSSNEWINTPPAGFTQLA